MPTITIPKKSIAEEELVAIPKKEYEEFVRAKRGAENIVVKRTMRVPKKYEKFYDELDKELTESLREVEAGHYYGPFDTADELIESLRRKRGRSAPLSGLMDNTSPSLKK